MTLVTKPFGDIVTFTRASGGGRFNASGQYEWLPAGQPRFDHDPVTGEPLGILIEEQRTNLLTYSSDFANAAWAKSASLSVTPNSTYSPDGGMATTKVVPPTSSAAHRLAKGLTTVAGSHVVSVTARQAGYSVLRVEVVTGGAPGAVHVSLVDGSYAYYGQGVMTGVWVSSTPGGFYRVSVAFTASAASTSLYVYALPSMGSGNTFTGDGTSGIYIWGAQLEVGSFPTSYIPTESSQVTRAADVCSVNTLSPWYNASEGTLFVEVVVAGSIADGSTTPLVSLDGGGTSDVYYLGRTATRYPKFNSRKAGVQDSDLVYVAQIPNNVAFKMAAAIRTNDCATSVDGGAPQTDTSVLIPAVTSMKLGNFVFGARLSGHLKAVRYYPRRLSNADLQTLTTP